MMFFGSAIVPDSARDATDFYPWHSCSTEHDMDALSTYGEPMATLDFKGKALVQNYHLAVKYYELVPKRNDSVTDKVSLHDNVIIEGDNLKALKALLPMYQAKVKCIY